jgi:hypothetical protein
MPALLRDLIQIPESVAQGDFVLKLTEGTDEAKAASTLHDYVVTPQLAECFDQALKLVQSAIQGQTSKAAYLHGSFGSGKSHFMAVLHFLLQGNTTARSIPELGDVVVRHNAWMGGKKFLMVPFHLLAAKDFESALFEGYVHYIFRHFPDAPTPGLFRSDELLRNAVSLRGAMGDEKFFAKLNEGRSGVGGGGGWGKLNQGWTADSYEAAIRAAPTDASRRKLVGDLVETHFTAMRSATEFVSIDDGLSIMSAHAKELGFDGLILFLDELILWLASHAGNVDFVSREAQKLPKLVESANALRPAPIISFVARQRDLRELVGQHIAGAAKLGFFDTLSYHEGRFEVIKLEDRNLPAITEKRVLRPQSEMARQQIDHEFARTAQLREDVQKVLVAGDNTRSDFRRLYPFSPALVDTLIAVSSLLQRERTALKIMMQLLVRGRDTLQLGQIIPVGDLFDEIAEGDDAFNSVMRAHFEEARKLYNLQLRPMLEVQHKLSFSDAAQLPLTDVRREALKNDDRLIKTLLLAALVPEVPSLQNMTPLRLSALNHGAIKSFVPGQEAQMVLKKCQDWAAGSGQIQVQEGVGNVFTISIRVSGVDIQSILDRAEAVNNYGNRVARLKNLLFESLGVNSNELVFFRHIFRWKGTDREADVQFGNIREMPDEMFESRSGNWRVLIDYPFDREGHSVREDIGRLDHYRAGQSATQTIAWLPSFLNAKAQNDIGILLCLEHILEPNRYRTFVDHLSEVDQAGARTLMDNQRAQLLSRLKAQVEAIYGLRPGQPEYVDPNNDLPASEHFYSLDGGLELRPPVAASLREALNALLHQALLHQFPGHPEFDDELKVTRTNVSKALEVVEAAANTKEPSVVVADLALRKIARQIANPLKVGQMADQRFQLEHFWRNHFSKHEARVPGEPVTVARVRAWIDEPQPQGLPVLLQDFIILAWATQSNRCFLRQTIAIPTPAPGDLTSDMVLRELTLPNQEEWQVAVQRAKAIFGMDASALPNATNVATLAGQVREKLKDSLALCQDLDQELTVAISHVALEPADCIRLKTVKEAMRLLEELHVTAGETPLVRVLASHTINVKPLVIGTTIKSAKEVTMAITGLSWELFDALKNLHDARMDRVTSLLEELKTCLTADEAVMSLKAKAADLQTRAVRLLAEITVPATPPPPVAPLPIEPPPIVIPQPTKQVAAKVRRSQIKGDAVPEWVPTAHKSSALVTVNVIDQTGAMKELVVTATLGRLINAAGDVRFDSKAGLLRFPTWECEASVELPEN